MIIIDKAGEGYPADYTKPTCLALGYFDGIHIGHKAVINAAAKYAADHDMEPGIFTFTGSSTKGKALQSPELKHEVMAQQGIKWCFEPPFNSFHALKPEEFFEQMLLQRYRAKALFCGEDYMFGAKRAGTIELLKVLCKKHSVELFVAPITSWDGEPVSSSRIRQALNQGDIEAANAMLGRPFEIKLPVQHGRGLGHKLGFPTINQIIPNWLQAPVHGVYITKTILDNKSYSSTTGFGPRPTIDPKDKAVTCETFINGYSGDLYDQQVRVLFYKKIAEIQKFETTELLTQAVKNWAAMAENYFS